MRLLATVAVLAASLPAAAAAAPQAPLVAAIDYPLESESVIGPLRIGTLCLPHGKLRWGDIRVPTERDGKAIIAGVLETDPLRPAHVEASLQSITVKICVPGAPRLIGKAKGTVVARWRWRTSSGNGDAASPYYMTESILDVSGDDPRRSARLMERALLEGSRAFLARH